MSKLYERHINGLLSIKPFMQSYFRTVDYEGLGELDATEVAETIDIAVDALFKQIPRKPVTEKFDIVYFFMCPSCYGDINPSLDEALNREVSYCEHCGQAID